MQPVRYNLIHDLTHHLDEKGVFSVGNCDSDLSARIEKLSLPIDLKRVFQWTWANKGGRLGEWKYYLDSTETIFSCEWFDRLLAAKMLEIGSAANGDSLVIKFSDESCEVGLLNCIELVGEEAADPNGFYVTVSESLDDLLLRMVEDKFLPIDYWSARQFSESKGQQK